MTDQLTPPTTDSPLTAPDDGWQRPTPHVLRRLERGLRADLSALRIHTGPAADRLAHGLGADAFACGAHVFFRRGAYRPDTPAGFRLLAHEAAHVVQQALGRVGGTGRGPRTVSEPGPWTVSEPGDSGEREADRWADAVVRGRAREGERVVVPSGGSTTIQRHVSFEHRILGDVPTKNLFSISTGGPDRDKILAEQIKLMNLWRSDPRSVTKQQLDALGVESLRIGPGEGLLVTYGELNALPDYLANAGTFNTVPTDTLLGILQCIRQEGFNQLTGIRTGKFPNDEFADAAAAPWKLSLVNTIVETVSLDQWTRGLGFLGEDHYQGLLARNACHFAPFSWYRWQSSHLVARDLAQRSYLAKQDPELARQALVHNGYADHFLQDSFAAGHLINKTLIMQWFLEWAAKQSLLPVVDWDSIKNMTEDQQPGLAGSALYDPEYTGPSNDPQTSQEAATLVRRVLGSGLVADKRIGLNATYQNFLTFLTSATAQLASGQLHDHYNEASVYVSSAQHTKPYLVWGDDTLLTGRNGGEGVKATSTATRLSQQALHDILTTGETGISVQDIRGHFPTRAGTDPGDLSDLKSWNTGQKESCLDMFSKFAPKLKEVMVGLATPRLGVASRDQDFTTVWSTGLPNKSLTYAPVRLALSGGRVFAGSYGYVYELGATSGKVLHSLLVTSEVGVGDYTTEVVTDRANLYAGVHGNVYIVSPDSWKVTGTASIGGSAYFGKVDVLAADGRLFAGGNGRVYEIDPRNGKILRSLLVTSQIGVGDYTTRIATDGTSLHVGVHGSVYVVSLASWKVTGSASVGGRTSFAPVEVRVARGQFLAGSNGSVYRLDPRSAKILDSLLLTDQVGVGDYTTRITTDGTSLYAGVHGYVYRVALDDWRKPQWGSGVGGVGAFRPVSVCLAAERVLVGSNGYVYEFEPKTGKLLNSRLLTSVLPTGGDYDTAVATDGTTLYAGVHGYASKVLVNNTSELDGVLFLDTQDPDGTWQGWQRDFDGAPKAGSVAALVGPARSLEVFAIAADAGLYHNSMDDKGRWQGWKPRFDGAPDGIQSVTGIVGPARSLEVFAVGADGALHHNALNDKGDWQGWDAKGFEAPPRPVGSVATTRIADRAAVWAVATDGTLYLAHQDETGRWSEWATPFDDAPPGIRFVSAFESADGTPEILAVGADGILYYNYAGSGGKWYGWQPDFDGAPPGIQSLIATKGPSADLEVLALTSDGSLLRNTLSGAHQWAGWQPDFDKAPSEIQSVAAILTASQGFQVFAVTADGTLHQNVETDGGTWRGWQADLDQAPPGVRSVTAAGVARGLQVIAVAL
ncbi:eCIS core domain-containing protein [Streptomyces europaeiscabiei]|uniref:eCIS core domain-containing protein n=1 Tax=Streptomyces europaeiscabiei TaxID=146819 RepID=UPI0038F70DFF